MVLSFRNWRSVTVGLLASLLLVGTDVATAQKRTRASLRIVARQVHDAKGVPLRESEIRVWLRERPSGDVTEADVFFQTMVKNPATDVESLIALETLSVRSRGKRLRVRVDGPVSQGSVLMLSEDVIGAPGGQQIILQGNRFLTSDEAALWGKAYEPTNVDLFSNGTYPDASPAVGIPQSNDPAVVRADLEAHFDAYIAAGFLTPGEKADLLAMFDNEDKRQPFVHFTTGVFEPQLMAMVLALAGTPAEKAITEIIEGENPTGRPAKVIYGGLDPDLFAGADYFIINNQLTWVITLQELFRDEPFETASAIMAHEAMHEDLLPGQDEEICAKQAEVNVWKRHLTVKPELAELGTRAAKFENLQTLWHENSGGVFPHGGIFEAILIQDPPNIGPNSSFVDPSFEVLMRTVFYPNTPDVDTPGHDYLDDYVSKMRPSFTNRRRHRRMGFDFNRQTLALLDNPSLFTPEENYRILEILQLQTVIK